MNTTCDLRVIDLVSGDVQRLTDNEHLEGGAAWSPTGRWIAFHRYVCGDCWVRPGEQYPQHRAKIWLIRPDGSGLHKLTGARRRGAREPNWHPRGRKLVVHVGAKRGARTPYEHFRIYARSGKFLAAVRNEGFFRYTLNDFQSPVWAPRGRTIAFRVSTGDEGGVGIWKLKADRRGYPYLGYNEEGYEPDWEPRPPNR